MRRFQWRRLTVECLESRALLHGGPYDTSDLPPWREPSGSYWAAAGEGSGMLVADFSLLDTNPTSPTHNQPVSPRDYLGQVSGWYFGHAT
ncbi:MAG: hypothetical protein J5I93_22835 [Pirellulaceae bacterium]|nr:hypothetical protein [Pirellulaceae bacterium]